MPADSPEAVHELYAQYFSNADIDALLSLYEEGASFVTASTVATGIAEIRSTLTEILRQATKMELAVRRVVRSGDLALVLSDWTTYNNDSSSVRSTGRTADVVRQQPDASWLIVIDNPYGGEAVSHVQID